MRRTYGAVAPAPVPGASAMGAVLGAVVGADVGAVVGAVVVGAAVGTVVGAVVGAVVGTAGAVVAPVEGFTVATELGATLGAKTLSVVVEPPLCDDVVVRDRLSVSDAAALGADEVWVAAAASPSGNRVFRLTEPPVSKLKASSPV
ncbi:hypothetical protein [Cryptosporangium minutisporangium]|uniref:hypothetical protein n=1 Tax=Cryptosporangium minutisporangium TaxID=113569 RepID=UPI0031EEA168